MEKIRMEDIVPGYCAPYHIETEKDLIFLGKPLIDEMIEDWKILKKMIEKISGLSKRIEQTPEEMENKIKILRGLKARARMKPAIPGRRPHGWFKKGSPVVIFIGRLPGKMIPNKFMVGKILDADIKGFVAVKLKHEIGNKQGRGHQMPRGLQQPEIMNSWEFEYLVKHPKFAEMWLASAVHQEIILKSHAVSFFSAIMEVRTHFRLQEKKEEN